MAVASGPGWQLVLTKQTGDPGLDNGYRILGRGRIDIILGGLCVPGELRVEEIS